MASLTVPGFTRANRRTGRAKPNFVIIFADDQGYQDVGCFGSPTIKTPNLDRMAAEGMKFTDFYSAAAICSPSRAALMTGCYPPRVGITQVLFRKHTIGLNPKEVTVADVLKGQGYATACVGKWHLGHLPEFLPTSNGFDTGDNGPWLSKKHHAGSALPLRDGKFTTYEGGMREPAICRWPARIPAGRVCSEISGTIDVLPTFAGLAGAAVPADRVIDGKDIWPLMAGKPSAKSPHKAYFYYRGTTLEAVRKGRWKLRRVKKKIELYDLGADISEKNNLAENHPDIVKRLTSTMEEFDAELKAKSRPPGKVEKQA
ncbi:MAG: sulfatase-like hydrolase/transferase [Phycisphaerae bacterium]|nr:sulfatase-like hydrolase/transferase [Phycisphaerae bacterium]